MKKTFVYYTSVTLCALCVLFALGFAGCTSRGDGQSAADSSGSSGTATPSVAESLPSQRPTMSEAANNNEYIDQEAIQLVQFEQPKAGDSIAVLDTSLGEIHIRLFPQYAPQAVENFTTLVQDGFYDGKPFHYVSPNSFIQNGAVNANGTGSKSVIPDEEGNPAPYPDEFSMDLWHFRGTVSCANPGMRDSNGSQFFIVQAKNIRGYTDLDLKQGQWPPQVVEQYEQVGGTPHQDWNHTIFGMVVEGMDVVDEIAAVETDESGAPVEPVLINTVTIRSWEPSSGAEESAESESESE